jgi:hypothetical protein
MIRFTLIKNGLLVILVTSLSAQVNAAPPSSIPIHNFAKTDRTLYVLQALAEEYHFVIGVHGVLADEHEPTIEISAKGGVLSDVFDAITKADQRFEWRQNSNGAVHFLTRDVHFSLTDVTVHSFDDDNPGKWEITDRLYDLPEIHDWLQNHKCVMPIVISIIGQQPPKWRKFSVHAHDISLSALLDEVAAKSRTYFYVAYQYRIEPCQVSIAWGNPQP